MKYLILMTGTLPILGGTTAQDDLSNRTHRISHVSTISTISDRSDIIIHNYDIDLTEWNILKRTVSCIDLKMAKKAKDSLLGYRISNG